MTHACLARLQVVASQKQLEMKYKQAQQIAVRFLTTCKAFLELLATVRIACSCFAVSVGDDVMLKLSCTLLRMTGTGGLSWRSAREKRSWPAKHSGGAKPMRCRIGLGFIGSRHCAAVSRCIRAQELCVPAVPDSSWSSAGQCPADEGPA